MVREESLEKRGSVANELIEFFKYFLTVIFQIFFYGYFSNLFLPLFFKYFFTVIFQIYFYRYFSNIF